MCIICLQSSVSSALTKIKCLRYSMVCMQLSKKVNDKLETHKEHDLHPANIAKLMLCSCTTVARYFTQKVCKKPQKNMNRHTKLTERIKRKIVKLNVAYDQFQSVIQ